MSAIDRIVAKYWLKSLALVEGEDGKMHIGDTIKLQDAIDLMDNLPEAQREKETQKWISTDEQLPDYGRAVLAFGRELDLNPILAYRLLIDEESDTYEWIDYREGYSIDREVEAWHPITFPRFLKEEKE